MIRVGMYKTVHFFLEKEGLKGSRNVVPERGRGGGACFVPTPLRLSLIHVYFMKHSLSCLIKRVIHGHARIWNLSSSVQIDIEQVHVSAANE